MAFFPSFCLFLFCSVGDWLPIFLSYGELSFRERARKKKEEEEKIAEREREKVFYASFIFIATFQEIIKSLRNIRIKLAICLL